LGVDRTPRVRGQAPSREPESTIEGPTALKGRFRTIWPLVRNGGHNEELII